MMRLLITGAAGFLGSHLCDRFLATGHSVVGVDNFITGRPKNIEHLSGHPQYRFHQLDVSDHFTIPGKFDAILHFASPASPNPASPRGYPNLPIETLKAGSIATFNTIEIAKQNGSRYLFASTSEIYGDPLEHPQPETYYGHVNPVGPRSMYDEAKRFGEAVVMAYHRKYNMDTRIVRIFNTYGPRMSVDDGRAVPNMIQQALLGQPLSIFGDGSQTRSFCYIDDMVEGILRLLQSTEHLPLNIGNDHEVSMLDLARLINRITGNRAGHEFHPDDRLGNDPQRRRPDLGRARAILGWNPSINLEAGLEKTIAYFRNELGKP